MYQSLAGTWGNLLMAASVMAVAPIALLFAIFNRHITAGLHLPRY
jgi:ABC-type glycerol-3-phosphate transport system permease component